jgi:radical SAM superfamily enzyme YgiQ (UPF0313 family)
VKKLLLVSANQYSEPSPVYPLGLSYLAAYLREKLPGLDIRIFDFAAHGPDDYAGYVQKYGPDYVGISLRNIDDVNIYRQESFLTNYGAIIERTRQCSRSTIIIGGPGYSIYPRELFDCLRPDFAICGEGEEGLYELLKALESRGDYTAVEGLVYSYTGGTRINEKKRYCPDPKVCFDAGLLDFYWEHGGMLNIQTKRGCPYQCIYCTYPLIEGSTVRTIDAGMVADTLADLFFNKKIDYVFFTDSVFNIDNDYNLDLAGRLISKKMDLKWGGYFNFANLDEKALRIFKKAGLTHIEFGTESLSDATLGHYGKPFTVADILDVSKTCGSLQIDCAHFLILGGYGETEDSLNETFENSKKLERTVFFPFIGMRIYPGTRLHRLALQEGSISKDDSLLNPVYYVSDAVDISLLKEKAKKTGRTWLFPDEDITAVMQRLRSKGKKGPLWEYLLR